MSEEWSESSLRSHHTPGCNHSLSSCCATNLRATSCRTRSGKANQGLHRDHPQLSHTPTGCTTVDGGGCASPTSLSPLLQSLHWANPAYWRTRGAQHLASHLRSTSL